MNKFLKELEIGEIHQRDQWQFELKSEFLPPSIHRNLRYTQEFYLFIPQGLQINEQTYSKLEFYQDQTNFIRYKTPEFNLFELLNLQNTKSPLARLSLYLTASHLENQLETIQEELKLFGNIFRSSVRKKVAFFINKIGQNNLKKNSENLISSFQRFSGELKQVRSQFLKIQKDFSVISKDKNLRKHFRYVDEFMSNTISYYLTGLLERFGHLTFPHRLQLENECKEILKEESQYIQQELKEPNELKEKSKKGEYVLYRKGLLNKFIFDALYLNTTRSSFDTRFRTLIGSISAGIAMLIFFLLFIWQGQMFLINSLPFIFITVLLYILKDRIKEELRTVSYRQFHRWFADYKTEIRSLDEKAHLGRIKESFSFIDEKTVSSQILKVRNRESHSVLEPFKIPESIIYYKKEITLFRKTAKEDPRLHGLNIIFRFNINRFLTKADDPLHSYLAFDPTTSKCVKRQLPKVYHLNIVLKNTYLQQDLSPKIEFKKFRIILDKHGIKRIEPISTNKQNF